MKEQTGKLQSINLYKWIAILIVTVAIVLLIISIVRGFMQNKFDVTFYQVTSAKVTSAVRLVMLSDLHLKQFGQGNWKLIKKIADLAPDLIVMAGDMDTRETEDNTVVLTLCSSLMEIAPIYYAYGNHEYDDILFHNDYSLTNALTDMGVHVVNNAYETVDVNGNTFDIGGFCADKANFYDNADDFMEQYEAEATGFKLLLCHHPNCFESVMDGYPVDLALSGHEHGGQIRLPLIGAIYTPSQGVLPKLVDGQHNVCGSTLIIGRGLGSGTFVPRFNNPPEIVVVDIDRR